MSVRKPGQFFKTVGWHKLRLQRLAFAHHQCECCGSRERLQLDHIEPRSVTGDRRRLGLQDVQILCASCNGRKGGTSLRAAELRDLLGIGDVDQKRRPGPSSLVVSNKPTRFGIRQAAPPPRTIFAKLRVG